MEINTVVIMRSCSGNELYGMEMLQRWKELEPEIRVSPICSISIAMRHFIKFIDKWIENINNAVQLKRRKLAQLKIECIAVLGYHRLLKHNHNKQKQEINIEHKKLIDIIEDTTKNKD